MPALGLLCCASFAQEIAVVGVQPAARSIGAATDTGISVTFDRPIDRGTIDQNSFWAFGRWSGTVFGDFAFGDDDRTVTLVPTRPLSAGEQVMVILSHDIRASDGSAMRAGGWSHQFWTAASPAPMALRERQVLDTRTVRNQSSRAYGGIGSDVNGDGALDISIVNEDTADLRVFLNANDAKGTFGEFLTPPTPLGDRASPNEPTDFDRDGNVDLCVANINVNSVSVLLGNGDGTFDASQVINVGSGPRGVAVLDADGDGDIDIVNTNSGSGNLSIMLNDGTGAFGAPTFFDGGGSGEWALGAADMDEDGMLDLVVGARSNERIIVHRANGDATFTQVSNRGSGGAVWMLNTGDVNGDGHADVACCNSSDNNGTILLGAGDGSLGAPTARGVDPFPLATDLGDLDGDGDLDWILSSFNGDWTLFLNDGAGGFGFEREFDAPRAGSCALMLDLDSDGDLDLALIDELEDVVIVVMNTCPADLTGSANVDDPEYGLVDGVVDADDFFYFLDRFVAGDLEVADITGNGVIDADDFFAFLDLFVLGCER